jgi:hypothetical protein
MFKKIFLATILSFACNFANAGDNQCDIGLNIARSNVRFISRNFDRRFVSHNDFIFEVPVTDLGLEYYYRVKDSAELSIDDDDLEKLSEKIVAKLISKLSLPTKPDAPPPVDNPSPDDTEPVEPASPETPTDKLKLKSLEILKKNCAKCHSGDTINGGLEIIKDNKLSQLNREQKFDIFIQAFEQKMPKGGDPLSDEDVIILKDWAKLK